MAKQVYTSQRFTSKSEALIDNMNAIVADYIGQGFRLTVRQLYYQLVARDVIPNTERSYKNTTSLVNDARLAGLMDWDAIEDRTRAFVRRQRWNSGSEILRAAANSYHMDMWENQDYRPFVIIEKEALVGVLEPVCASLDVPVLAARGYPSASVLREFAVNDLLPVMGPQTIVIIHLGDHDPSGIDMSRDLRDRIDLFTENEYNYEFVRVALNMEQIEERKPPPNPAKTTDSRFADYQRKFGEESWELDALPPSYLVDLVQSEVDKYRNSEAWAEREATVEAVKSKLERIAKRFRI
jgi:hypothetical protein